MKSLISILICALVINSVAFAKKGNGQGGNAANDLPNESSKSLEVIINEVNTDAGYAELYFNSDQDITDWSLHLYGQGSVGENSCALEGSYERGTFVIITNDAELNTNGSPRIDCADVDFHSTQNEAVLFDENGDVVHYISMWNGGNTKQKNWPYEESDGDFVTIADENGAYDNVCTLIDGDANDPEWEMDGDYCSESTPGYSNMNAAVSYRFDECTLGDKLTDEYGNDATLIDGDKASLEDAQVCNGLNLGATGYLQPDNGIATGDEWSMSTWIKFPLDQKDHGYSGNGWGDFLDLLSGKYKTYNTLLTSSSEKIYFEYSVEYEFVCEGFLCLNGYFVPESSETFIATNDTKLELANNLESWHHFTLTQAGDDIQIYQNGQSLGRLNDIFTQGITKLFGSDTDGETLGASVDETKFFDFALTENKVLDIYENEAAGKRWTAAEANCPDCDTPVEHEGKFDVWDGLDKKWLGTKLVDNTFDVVVVSLDKNDPSQTKQFNGTVCVQPYNAQTNNSVGNWQQVSFKNDAYINLSDLEIDRAVKRAKYKIQWNSGQSEQECPLDTENEEWSDEFSIRPQTLGLSLGSDPIIAQTPYSITTSASAGGYDQSFGADSVNVTKYDPDGTQNSSLKGTATHDPFDYNGTTSVNISNFTYSDVGDIGLWLEDTTWTSVDQSSECYANDCPDNKGTALQSGLYGCNICSNEENVTVVPDRFDVNINSFATSSGNDFVYYDNNESFQNAELNTTIQAVGSADTVLQNYHSGLYSNDSNISIDFTYSGESDLEMNYVVDGISDTQVFDQNMTVSLSESQFANGEANSSIYFNFTRDFEVPKNPIEFTAADVTVTDSVYPSVDGNASQSSDISFYYARTRPVDLTTSKKDDNTTVYIDVYSQSDNLVGNMKQQSINWYRFDKDSVSSIDEVKIKDKNLTSNTAFTNGVATVPLKRSDDDIGKDSDIIYLEIPAYLWHGSEAYKADEKCKSQPCIYYQYLGGSGGSGVSSGDFGGSEIDPNSSESQKPKGVKIFR